MNCQGRNTTSSTRRHPHPPAAVVRSQPSRRAATSPIAETGVERNGRRDLDSQPSSIATQHKLNAQRAARLRQQWTASPLAHLNVLSQTIDFSARRLESPCSRNGRNAVCYARSFCALGLAWTIETARGRLACAALTTSSGIDDDQSKLPESSNLGRRRSESSDLG